VPYEQPRNSVNSNKTHDSTSQKTTFFIVTAVKNLKTYTIPYRLIYLLTFQRNIQNQPKYDEVMNRAQFSDKMKRLGRAWDCVGALGRVGLEG
jgi:hypothetical protein